MRGHSKNFIILIYNIKIFELFADIRMECQFRKTSGVNCPFKTILRSIKTFDPSDPLYFTPGNWRFLPDSERMYKIPGRLLNPKTKSHKCAGRELDSGFLNSGVTMDLVNHGLLLKKRIGK